MHATTTPTAVTAARPGLRRAGNALTALLLGLTLLAGVGLAGSETLHQATHDVRHATGFPCH